VNSGATGWVNHQYFAAATASGTALQFGFRDDPGYLGFDDVSVTPVPPPAFQGATLAGGNVSLSWSSQAGLVFQVQYTTNLVAPNWISLGGNITATGNPLSVTDTNAVAGSPQRFYRLLMLP